jgi:hypothetical protein
MPRGPALQGTLADHGAIGSNVGLLRVFAITAGIGWSVAFVVIALRYQLQLYGDGSIFSYAVAVQDAWAFHWHNISGRLFVYLYSYVPAESYVALTGDARGGIALFGFLFFAAPLLGLAATYAADRSQGRTIFVFACLSTACLCPLVFGFPTEMWIAHAVFWPALTICHYARAGVGGVALVFMALLALVLAHGGGLVFAAAIMATLLLRGGRDGAFRRAAGTLLAVLAVWGFVNLRFPSDEYFSSVLPRAALNFVDVTTLASGLFLLILVALAGYGIAVLNIRPLTPAKAYIYATAIVALALAAYWLWFDRALHTIDRYFLRTALLYATPVLGALAAAYALRADGRLNLRLPLLPRLMTVLADNAMARVACGAIALVILVHAVETAKFVAAWTDYKSAVRALAMGTASDPGLGDPRFVSSVRIDDDRNRLAWSSTTHFLSVLVAPNYAPARLVVDPDENYFWLPCKTATASRSADSAIPATSRELVRVHACRHR